MKNIQQIKDYADLLKLTQLKKSPEDILCTAQADKPGYGEFVLQLLRTEVNYRKKTDMDKRLKLAKLPKTCDLSQYDYSVTNGILKMELEGLRELLWIEQNFNVMMFPINKQAAIAFFNMINKLHEHTSFIITSNKSPTQWAEVLEDPALTGALMDRLLFKSQTFLLHGSSYRMDHRQSIFPDQRQAAATGRETN